ncbi:hypothetical protein TEA_001022 [Camellia sinensis var. sinensis]|uniref:Dolichyl-diphosphooligosaccharide-protein glycosyltransferase subunit OST5 n=1 Tax=Camellia sinensis var. sinensis TaxID=542762 RepID=A0A4S4E8E3_CAMSN|nr:hypothetical protein TEA_001022 [Camellia sinensis var. sinensis]
MMEEWIKIEVGRGIGIEEVDAVESVKPISSPVPDAWYPTLSVLMLSIGLVITAAFFMKQADSKTKKSIKLASNHSSYNGGTTEEDLFSCELWSSSSRRVTGTPIKKLLAEEMSKETESKRQPPSVIARLMGLDGLPP